MLIRLMATELIRQKELGPYSKEIQQIWFDEQLKILYNVIVANESTFVLTILEKKAILKFSQGSVAETVLITNHVNFQDEELLHELFLTIRQATKIRNAIGKNMSTDIKLRRPRLSKMIQSGLCNQWFY